MERRQVPTTSTNGRDFPKKEHRSPQQKQKRNIETGARASMRGKLVFFGHFFHTKFLLFLTQHRETSKGFYLIFLFWCTFSVCKVVPLLSKVYLKRNPFNYRAQIAAVFLPYPFLRHHQATGFSFVAYYEMLGILEMIIKMFHQTSKII